MTENQSLIEQCKYALRQARDQISVMAIYCDNAATESTLNLIRDAIIAIRESENV